jgi:hypothetical protein
MERTPLSPPGRGDPGNNAVNLPSGLDVKARNPIQIQKCVAVSILVERCVWECERLRTRMRVSPSGLQQTKQLLVAN